MRITIRMLHDVFAIFFIPAFLRRDIFLFEMPPRNSIAFRSAHRCGLSKQSDRIKQGSSGSFAHQAAKQQWYNHFFMMDPKDLGHFGEA